MCHCFVKLCSWNCNWAKSLLLYFWLCNLLILVFAMVLKIWLTYLAQEEIIKLYLHNSLSCMSTLFMALQFDEEWNIIWLISFWLIITSVQSRKWYTFFHWLATNFFERLTNRCVVFYRLCLLGFHFHVIFF